MREKETQRTGEREAFPALGKRSRVYILVVRVQMNPCVHYRFLSRVCIGYSVLLSAKCPDFFCPLSLLYVLS